MNDTTQWFHDQTNGVTYAVNVDFSKEALLNIVHQHTRPLTVLFGISVVHPDDTYNKEVGRTYSKGRQTPVDLHLEQIQFKENIAYVRMTTEDLTFLFRVHTDSDKPHLLQVIEKYAEYF